MGSVLRMSEEQVQQTLYFPLLGRARAARRYPELFEDPWALGTASFAEKEGTPVSAMAGFPDIVYGLRHRVTVSEIRRYLADHPGAAVVNIGCGLDSLAGDLADLDCRIYNLDFPEVIELRERWYRHTGQDSAGERALAYPVTDHRWMDEVDGSAGMVAVAAGVFFYLEVDDVRALVDALGRRFPGGRLCYDSESPWMMEGSERQIRKHGTQDAAMPFRVKDPESAREWSPTVTDVTHNFVDALPTGRRGLLPWRFRALFGCIAALKSMYEVRVSF